MAYSEPDDIDPDQAPPAPGTILPFQRRNAPDWLASPADDLGTPPEGQGPATVLPLPAPVLRRPGPAAHAPAGAPPTPASGGDARGSSPRDGTPARPWTPAASSVPVLRSPLPRMPAEQAESPLDRTGCELPGPARDRVAPAGAAPALAPLAEPWWMIALDSLRTDRRVQAAAAAMLLTAALLAWWLWPRGVGSTSIAAVRKHPKQFDGRTIEVRGRVGHDVFPVAGGYTFFLLQGRDTIVAFSRGTQPQPGDVLTVKGQVSTGFLDGAPRQALFESEAKP